MLGFSIKPVLPVCNYPTPCPPHPSPHICLLCNICAFLSCVSHGQENIFQSHEGIHITPPIDFLLAKILFVRLCVLVTMQRHINTQEVVNMRVSCVHQLSAWLLLCYHSLAFWHAHTETQQGVHCSLWNPFSFCFNSYPSHLCLIPTTLICHNKCFCQCWLCIIEASPLLPAGWFGSQLPPFLG